VTTTPSYTTRVRELRQARGLNMHDLAYQAGISIGVIDRLEKATHLDEVERIGVGQFIKVAAVLGTTAVKLLPELGEAREMIE